MDTIALWIGYTVLGVALSIFIVGGCLMIFDFFTDRMQAKLNAAQELYLIELRNLNKLINDARFKGEPTIPQPQPERRY